MSFILEVLSNMLELSIDVVERHRPTVVKVVVQRAIEDSPMANLLLSVMGAFAEFERALIRERQREGIALAKQRGAYRGRKKALVDDQVVELRRRAGAGEQKSTLAREFGISRETLYQYLKVAATA
jgi:DNA invertase Pin-like site-specific DNA recombinase